MSKLLKLISGYKTYSVAIMIVIAGFNMVSAGDWQGGLLHVLQAPEMLIVFSGMGLGALRESVANLLLALKEPPKFPDNTAAMDDYLFVDDEGKPISKAEHKAMIELSGMKPVMGLKS